MSLRPAGIILGLLLLAHDARAHSVPSLTVEAEFSLDREVTLKVKVDPRLLFSKQPAALPAVPSSWWLEQNAAARGKTEALASSYVDHVVKFTVGDTPVPTNWKIIPIDSASAFPLGANSAEVDLLAEHTGPLPDVAGDFKLLVAGDCSVAVILLTSTEGKPDRRPQSLFPGESSRGVKLPPLKAHSETPAPAAASPAPKPAVTERPSPASGGGHYSIDHLLIALVLGMAARARVMRVVSCLVAFHAAHLLGMMPVLAGWLPAAPPWMTIVQWIGIAAGLVAASSALDRPLQAALCFAAAGLAHGLDLPHLHVAPEDWAALRPLLGSDGLLLGQQLALALATCGVLRACQAKTSEEPAG